MILYLPISPSPYLPVPSSPHLRFKGMANFFMHGTSLPTDPLLRTWLKNGMGQWGQLFIADKRYKNMLNVGDRSVSQERRRLRDRLSDDRNAQNLFKGFFGKCND